MGPEYKNFRKTCTKGERVKELTLSKFRERSAGEKNRREHVITERAEATRGEDARGRVGWKRKILPDSSKSFRFREAAARAGKSSASPPFEKFLEFFLASLM